MIIAQELRNQLAFALDAEGSDHYRDDLDYIPAINASMKWLTAVVNSAIGSDKFSSEFFREITFAQVFKTDLNSRVSLDVFPSEVWSILAIYPKPTVSGSVIPTPILTQSYYMNGLIHVESNLDCKRLNVEEWAKNKSNPFEAGYSGSQICDDLKRYAYLDPVNYEGVNTGVSSKEIEIRPKLLNEYATVFWVKKPSTISLITDNIEFPSSCFSLLFNKALSYISYKVGDNSTTYSVSNNDINQLLKLM